MSAGMNMEEAQKIANKMSFTSAVYNALNANGTNPFSNVLLQNCWIGIDDANKIAIIIILITKYLIFAIK